MQNKSSGGDSTLNPEVMDNENLFNMLAGLADQDDNTSVGNRRGRKGVSV